MKNLIQHILLFFLFSSLLHAAITIDQEEIANGICPGEVISTLDNLTNTQAVTSIGTMQTGWDIDRFYFRVTQSGVITLNLSASQPLTIKAGTDCNTQTYFRSENSTDHVQEFRVNAGEVVNLSLFDWSSGSGYNYALDIDFIADNNIPIVDTTAPVITLLGDNPLNLHVGDTFTEPGFTVIDNVDGDLSDVLNITTNVHTDTAGTYTILYTVADTAGNPAQIVRTVIVSNEPVTPSGTGVVINEVLTANASINLDPDFNQYSDWIELYNYEDYAIDLSGYYLSDKIGNVTKWKFPDNTIIEPHDYLLIWTDDENIQAKALHTNFKLSQDGESIILSDTQANIIDQIDFPQQEGDISCVKMDGILYPTNTGDTKQ